MIQPGIPTQLGATSGKDGVNFALYSGGAEAVELCFFDENRQETIKHLIPHATGGVWHAFVPGCLPGQRYGYRVHGPWAPKEGLRYNPAKLLIDPYARRLDGDFRWDPALFDFAAGTHQKNWQINSSDSAPFVPLGVVDNPGQGRAKSGPWIPWADTIVYEANVRGYTMCHPDVPPADRGKFCGLSNGRILEYLKALGITSIELMPVHTLLDEAFLVEKGLRNFWGYNSVQFFTPDQRFAGSDPVAEFREMVNAIHDAGLEVILDVVYNHTAEGSELGPSLSFRGIDSQAYYRHAADKPGHLINDTGCGNTLNTNHVRVQELILDSLVYWHRDMGVDGFRFDLAPVLGRTETGFSRKHPLMIRIGSLPELDRAKLIAEPWDTGPGGYQLGAFPMEWAEWNDQYRDCVRRYWRGDAGQSSEFARRIHGSADLFEHSGRDPFASINFVSSHDGFTLLDLVSFERKHNEANGEENRDGHGHNFSSNFGVEGVTQDAGVNRLRRRQRLNLLATLLFSQGTPMLLAGDEFGNSQGGNNNAYAQDNEDGWLNWTGLETDPGFTDKVRELIHLRRVLPLLRLARYIHRRTPGGKGWCDITWQHPDGRPMGHKDWANGQQISLFFTRHEGPHENSPIKQAMAILFNASPRATVFTLPDGLSADWALRFFSSEQAPIAGSSHHWELEASTIALASMGADGVF